MTIDFAAATRATLASMTDADSNPAFDPATLDGLPPPAQRFLNRALPPGVALSTAVELTMDGKIKLGGRWLPFTANQILLAGVGFVWAPIVGGRIIRFTGADVLGPTGARIEFRFHGHIPVVRGSGPDIERSAVGRLAAETVAWLPQALTPQAGATWIGTDDQHATVTFNAGGQAVDVDVEVEGDGQLKRLGLQRWNDSAKPPEFASFGGAVSSLHTTDDGVAIAGSGIVGWDWGTSEQADGEFFRYTINSAHFL